jgi:hypothetical protein
VSAPFSIKRGEALNITLQLAQDDGTPIDISNATLFSEVRDLCGELLATPQVAPLNATLGQISYRVLSDATWPIGRVVTDVAVSFSGLLFHTDTAFIEVRQPVTLWEDQNAS